MDRHTFNDPMTTATAMDRLVHHSIIVEIDTESCQAGPQEPKELNRGVPQGKGRIEIVDSRASEEAVFLRWTRKSTLHCLTGFDPSRKQLYWRKQKPTGYLLN